MQRSTLMTIVFAVGFLMFPFDVTGQIPRTLSYQGILTDTSGTPKPDGNYGIAFRLYNVPGGGSALWTETKTLQVRRGLFSAILGSQTPFPPSLAFDRQYWLSIQVSPDPELTPRIQITAVGYSLNASRADTALYARTAPGSAIADSARIAGTVPNNSITSVKIAAGQVVKSLNGIRDAVTMRAQGGATITSSGDTIVINAGSGGGGTGVQSIQNTNNTFDIMNPTGPTVTTNLKVPLSLSANVDTANSAIITASNTAATNLVHGVIGRTSSSTADAAGVLGEALATTGGTTGVIGRGTASSNGTGVAGFGGTRGVYGTATASSGSIYGVRGVATSSSQGTGVYGEGTLYGVAGASPSASGVGVNGTGGLYGGTFTGGTYGVQANGPYVGVLGMTLSTLSGSQGVRGVAAGSSGLIYGVQGITNSTTFLSSGVRGEATASSGQTIGVEGVSYASPIGTGVSGRGGAVGGYFEAFSSSGTGVYGFGSTGIYGQSFTAGGTGVQGVIEHNITVSSWGVWGRTSAPGQAGHFSGNVEVAGNLSKTTGSFKIDHPLDPANKYLYHSFVESPDMMNIYNGNVELDGNGEAVVTLPAWFEALNKEFRYQLTCIGGFAPVYVAEEVRRNQFKIAGGKVGMKVSWQVTGIRHDAYAEKHPIPVEEEKPHIEKGHYLHPDVFNQPEERSIEWAVRPEAMRRLKEMRENPKRSEIPSLPTTPQAKEQW